MNCMGVSKSFFSSANWMNVTYQSYIYIRKGIYQIINNNYNNNNNNFEF